MPARISSLAINHLRNADMPLYGECITCGRSAKVRVSGLAATGCDLESDGASPLDDGETTLWIGAIGPFPVTTVRQAPCHLSARFCEPLDSRILEHFAAA